VAAGTGQFYSDRTAFYIDQFYIAAVGLQPGPDLVQDSLDSLFGHENLLGVITVDL
jgi:hypothetical protein